MRIIKCFIAMTFAFSALVGCSSKDKNTITIADKIKGDLVYSGYTEDKGFFNYNFLFLVKNESDDKLDSFDIDELEKPGVAISNGKEIRGNVESTYIEDLYPNDEQYLSVSVSTDKQTNDIGFKYNNDKTFAMDIDKIKNIGNWTNKKEKDKTKFQNDEISMELDLSQSKITGGPKKDSYDAYYPNSNHIEDIKFTVTNKTDHVVYVKDLNVSLKLRAYELTKTRKTINTPVMPMTVSVFDISSRLEDVYWAEYVYEFVPEELQVLGGVGFILNPNQKIEGKISFDGNETLYFPDKTSKSISVDEIVLVGSNKE